MEGSFSIALQLIGNVCIDHHITSKGCLEMRERGNLQLQQGQVSVAVISFFFTLLRNIVLEDSCGLGVVSV